MIAGHATWRELQNCDHKRLVCVVVQRAFMIQCETRGSRDSQGSTPAGNEDRLQLCCGSTQSFLTNMLAYLSMQEWFLCRYTSISRPAGHVHLPDRDNSTFRRPWADPWACQTRLDPAHDHELDLNIQYRTSCDTCTNACLLSHVSISRRLQDIYMHCMYLSCMVSAIKSSKKNFCAVFNWKKKSL
jgi:hypothetical protein